MKPQIVGAVILPAILCGICLVVHNGHASGNISSCDTIVLSSPRGNGVSYKGTIDTDYLTAVIPPGLTGWGAGPGAPFHGFIIYFENDDKQQSCIRLHVGIVVDLPEDEETKSANFESMASRGRKVKIGNKVGYETSERGIRDGVNIDNISTVLQFDRHFIGKGGKTVSYTVGVGVLLVTPTKDRHSTEPVFRMFLSQLNFQ